MLTKWRANRVMRWTFGAHHHIIGTSPPIIEQKQVVYENHHLNLISPINLVQARLLTYGTDHSRHPWKLNGTLFTTSLRILKLRHSVSLPHVLVQSQVRCACYSARLVLFEAVEFSRALFNTCSLSHRRSWGLDCWVIRRIWRFPSRMWLSFSELPWRYNRLNSSVSIDWGFHNLFVYTRMISAYSSGCWWSFPHAQMSMPEITPHSHPISSGRMRAKIDDLAKKIIGPNAMLWTNAFCQVQ